MTPVPDRGVKVALDQRPELAQVIARVPGWAERDIAEVSEMAGLTNRNYLVTVGVERYVVRVSRDNARYLGIDREGELAALRKAEACGIGAEVVDYLLPEGHLVTRLIDGRSWTLQEYATRDALATIIETVKRVHGLSPMARSFSPWRRIGSYAVTAKARGVAFPDDFDELLAKAEAIRGDQVRDAEAWRGFCHNDLYSVNLLDDGNVRVIDWEFAGMGDVYFDLATMAYAYDEASLSPELEAFLLEDYFGSATPWRRLRLEGMKAMLLFFTAMWGLLQEGLVLDGTLPRIELFDYYAYAQTTFGMLREQMGMVSEARDRAGRPGG